MKLSNLNLDSPKIRQGMNRLWMVITGMTSILVSIVVGTQDSDNWFPALLITGLVMYPTGLTLYWLAHWIIQGFKKLPPPDTPPRDTKASQQSQPPPPPNQHKQKKKKRIGRATFAVRYLLMWVAGFVLGLLSAIIEIPELNTSVSEGAFLLILYTVFLAFCLLLFILLHLYFWGLRLHDLNRSAWWALLVFVPPINFVLLLVLFFAKGSPGENEYGMPEGTPNPPPPRDNKLWRTFVGGWSFIRGGPRGSSRWLIALAAVIVVAVFFYILTKPPPAPNVSVAINAVPYAEVFIKPPQSDKYTPPVRPDERYTPVTLEVPVGTDIKMRYKESEKEFRYEDWKKGDPIWHDFLEQ